MSKKSDLLDELLKIDGAEFLKVREYEWISAGHAGLNYTLSGDMRRGIPLGCIIEIFGAEGLGKSTLGYAFLAEIQRVGGVAVLVDVEGGFNASQIQRANIPHPKKIITCKKKDLINVVAFIYKACEFLAEKKQKGIILWDSYAATRLDAQTGGMAEEARIMSVAMKKFLSIIPDSQVSLVIINQLRDNMKGRGIFTSTTQPGGWAMKHGPQIRIELNKTSGREKICGFMNDNAGKAVIATITKSKFHLPGQCQLGILYKYGLDWEFSLMSEAYVHGLIKPEGGWWKWEGKSYRKTEFWLALKEDEKMKEELEKRLEAFYKEGEV